MIIEGIMTSRSADGIVNVAPMGPRLLDDWDRFLLRPYQTSTTYRNLKQTGEGIFHVTDDVELLARAAIGKLDEPPLEAVPDFRVPRLADTCRWYALRVESLDDSQDRTEIVMRKVASGHVRDFFGLNRAKHAVVEAAILATRVHLLQPAEIAAQYAQLRIWVEKTGGPAEERAFALLAEYVRGQEQENA
jgi:uncharacterized protein